MAGIYLHIPFCKKACSYCDFHFSTQLSGKEALLKAMHQELATRSHELPQKAQTIYFGGGTPSLLTEFEISGFLKAIAHDIDSEITLEVNPDDVSQSAIDSWLEAGINRLSIGIQSFFEPQLSAMGRAHNREQALQSLALISNAGFKSWSLDLIYGLPKLNKIAWQETIEQALQFNPPHLSSYCLTVEEGTALHHAVSKGKIQLPENETQAAQFEYLSNTLTANGYMHYEISNFAKPEHLALHNTNYWKRIPYVGIGPSAHSFNGNTRRWNIRNNARYILALQKGESHFESETIDARTADNEKIMTGLRTMWGLNLKTLSAPFRAEQQRALEEYANQGALRLEKQTVILSNAGKLLADRIASDLFFIE